MDKTGIYRTLAQRLGERSAQFYEQIPAEVIRETSKLIIEKYPELENLKFKKGPGEISAYLPLKPGRDIIQFDLVGEILHELGHVRSIRTKKPEEVEKITELLKHMTEGKEFKVTEAIKQFKRVLPEELRASIFAVKEAPWKYKMPITKAQLYGFASYLASLG